MNFFFVFSLVTLAHVLIIIGVSIRVIKIRLPVATSLAWLLVVFFLPLVGAIGYLVFGEKGLGRKCSARANAIKDCYETLAPPYSVCPWILTMSLRTGGSIT